MTVPCYHCPDRQAGCHAQCAAYRAFRAELDERNAAARLAAAVNDAGAARGDKIRRDVRRHLDQVSCALADLQPRRPATEDPRGRIRPGNRRSHP